MNESLTLRERQWQLREQAILEAAHALLAELGYSATTMDEVAARTGISKATLYQHVASKEELAVRVIARAMDRLAEVLAAVPAARSPLERLEAAIGYMLEQRLASRRPDLHARRPIHHPFVRDHPLFQAAHGRMEAQLVALIEEARAAGELAPGLPTPLIVTMLMASIRDADFEALLAEGHLTVAELRDGAVGLLFEGIRPR